MDYAAAKRIRDCWQAEVDTATEALKAHPRNAMGLTPDEVKFSPAYRRDKRHFDNAFENLREWNGFIARNFAGEAKRDRKNRA